jgi:RHS repeat-associated protein
VLAEKVGSNAKRYVWSPVYVDAMVLRERDTDGNGSLDERLWVQQDANWNVTALVNGSGAVVERYAYDPYGSVTIYDANYSTVRTTSSYGWTQGFQGMMFDAVAGLNEADRRWYSPALMRWVAVDPSGLGPDVNDYRFVGNNPSNLTDPSGLKVYVYASSPQAGTGSSTFFHVSIIVTDGTKMVRYDGVGPEGGPRQGKKTIIASAWSVTCGVGFAMRLIEGSPTVPLGANKANRAPDNGVPETLPQDVKDALSDKNKMVLVHDGKFEEEVAALNKAYSDMKQIDVYNAIEGPNSNTYARQLLVNAGYTPPKSLPFLAPAFDYSGDNGYGGPNYDEKGNRK